MLCNLAFKGTFVCPHHTVNLFAILNKEKCRNTANIPTCSNVPGLIYVNFHKNHFWVLFSQACINKGNEATRATPCCSKIQDRQAWCLYAALNFFSDSPLEWIPMTCSFNATNVIGHLINIIRQKIKKLQHSYFLGIKKKYHNQICWQMTLKNIVFYILLGPSV